MRPTPEEPDLQSGGDGHIISLGDVRRRRAARTRAPDSQYLLTLLFVAAFSWVAWITVVISIPPQKLLTYLAFFIPLWCAMATTATLGLYGYLARRGRTASIRLCARRGALASSFLIVNLALIAAHRDSLVIAAIAATVTVVADLIMARGDPTPHR